MYLTRPFMGCHHCCWCQALALLHNVEQGMLTRNPGFSCRLRGTLSAFAQLYTVELVSLKGVKWLLAGCQRQNGSS